VKKMKKQKTEVICCPKGAIVFAEHQSQTRPRPTGKEQWKRFFESSNAYIVSRGTLSG